MTRDETRDDGAGERAPSADEAAALRALEAVPLPQAPDLARARARAAFVRGEVGVRTPEAIAAPGRGRRRFLAAALAAALPVLAAAIFVYGSRPESAWFVTDMTHPAGIDSGASALVEGAEVPAGKVATGGQSDLGLQLGRRLRLRMQPGSSVVLPGPPGRWFGRTRTLALERGEIYGTTSGAALGFTLRITTPEATADVLGTTFAAFRTGDGTCFCLWSGDLAVRAAGGGEPQRVPPQMKYYVYKDGRPPELLPIDDTERMKLSMMHDSGLAESPRR